MREIKFRAWDKNLGKWCEGNDARGFNLFGEAHLIGGILQGGYYSHNVFERLFSDVEVMQFTGLKDIFESDIVERDGSRGIVFWDKSDLQWKIRSVEKDSYGEKYITRLLDGSPRTASQKIKVIGNIYENPELLKS